MHGSGRADEIERDVRKRYWLQPSTLWHPPPAPISHAPHDLPSGECYPSKVANVFRSALASAASPHRHTLSTSSATFSSVTVPPCVPALSPQLSTSIRNDCILPPSKSCTSVKPFNKERRGSNSRQSTCKHVCHMARKVKRRTGTL